VSPASCAEIITAVSAAVATRPNIAQPAQSMSVPYAGGTGRRYRSRHTVANSAWRVAEGTGWRAWADAASHGAQPPDSISEDVGGRGQSWLPRLWIEKWAVRAGTAVRPDDRLAASWAVSIRDLHRLVRGTGPPMMRPSMASSPASARGRLPVNERPSPISHGGPGELRLRKSAVHVTGLGVRANGGYEARLPTCGKGHTSDAGRARASADGSPMPPSGVR
jgi:hypothetical protein